MAQGRARVAASILTADFGNLYRVVRKLEKAGVDRLHLDVMDGHFVPNLTFGPAIVASLRRLTKLPLDVHLMISEPSKFVERFIEAGSDSITFHVEVPESHEQKLATLGRVKEARLGTGLAVSPATPVSAVEPYLPLIDIIMIMTVEPGFGGQKFIKECAPKVGQAYALFKPRPHGWEVHVDGGISRDTAMLVGGYGADILVVGSALFQRGHDTAREVRLVRRFADEGWKREIGRGEPPIPRDEWRVVAQLPKSEAEDLGRRIEQRGVPTMVLRTGPYIEGVEAERVVMVPAAAEVWTRKQLKLGYAPEDDL
ncbi:MAG TPA: ribulose-phosphate 3-epimerase [Candidatus Limnocylindrales bacterium]|nr:ribulose-phosphate 3-epimerase [Candidatus Limnocylindrales bacterium]